jgi:hypothetical protein
MARPIRSIDLYLPLDYNDSEPIPESKYVALQQELLTRFAREWQAVVGNDAGLEQQVSQLLESAEHIPVANDPFPEVDAAVERDAVLGSTG